MTARKKAAPKPKPAPAPAAEDPQPPVTSTVDDLRAQARENDPTSKDS